MKERIKSVVLIVLVFLNLILGSQVLSTKKLWSGDGHNFFISLSNFKISDIFGGKKTEDTVPKESQLDAPELIIVNTGDQTTRRSLNLSSDDFDSLTKLAAPFLNDAFSGKNTFENSSTEDFYTALTAKSLYLRYPTEYDSALFSYLLGVGDTSVSEQFSLIRNIVISTSGYIYIEDAETRSIARYKTTLDTEELEIAIDRLAESIPENSPVINYAFDLGFDKAFATQKTILSPMIPIYSDGFLVETVISDNPLVSDGKLNEERISEILPLFDMNPNALRRYTEVDGTIVFVENDAILKISETGLLEYKANTDNLGVIISKNPASKFGTVAPIVSFVDKVNTASGSTATVKLSSKLSSQELDSESFNVSLDYMANGIPIIFMSKDSAVNITVTNGKITSYKQQLMHFKGTGKNISVDTYITALDEAIVKYQNQINGIEISGMDIAYFHSGTNGELLPDWNVSIKEIVID